MYRLYSTFEDYRTCSSRATPQKWRNAVDLRHTPVSKSALVSTEARPARPVDIPNWSAWQDLHLQPFRLERNASALGYTRQQKYSKCKIGLESSDVLSQPQPKPV